MHLLIWFFLYLLAAIGHMGIWVFLFNQFHGTNLNNRLVRRGSYPFFGFGILILPPVLYFCGTGGRNSIQLFPGHLAELQGVFGGYVWCCLGVFCLFTVTWGFRQASRLRPPACLLSQRTTCHDFSETASHADLSGVENWLVGLPGNQVYQAVVEEREILLSQVAADLDGLTMTHLSDFHFTGKISREYFDNVIEVANGLESDVVVITGDVIDSRHCWSWLEQVLGRLRAPKGIFYILGNHDQRVKEESRLRNALDSLGFIGVANRWSGFEIGNQRVHIAGNELPWFGKRMEISRTPENFRPGDLRILLSHSPDQWRWGRATGFDLTLAGHTHGGQIRLPVIGPVVTPSRHGVKYASGVFEKFQQTLVVSRGISGEEPIRFNCPPEVGKIIIRTRADDSSELSDQKPVGTRGR